MAAGYSYTVKELDDSQIEILVKVEADRYQQAKNATFARLAPEVKVPGFRPGKAPKGVIEARLGGQLLEESVNSLLPIITAEIIQETNHEPLDYARYDLKKISDEEGLEYTATFTIVPNIKLPDFKELKVKQDKVEVTEKEVEDLFKQLVKDIKANKEKEAKAGANKDDKQDTEINWEEELKMPEVKTEEDVKATLKKNLEVRREEAAEEKYYTDLVKEALKLAKLKAPKPLVESQVHAREHQYEDRIEKLGLKVEDFLKTQNTTMEKLKESWAEEADFQIASDLLFINISKAQELKVEPAEVEAEVAKITDPKLKDDYSSPNAKNYIASVLLRQKAINWLKEQAA
jgi:FKBP-type peptidyl-prolyl cis-trans isomerase (trigger factor)